MYGYCGCDAYCSGEDCGSCTNVCYDSGKDRIGFYCVNTTLSCNCVDGKCTYFWPVWPTTVLWTVPFATFLLLCIVLCALKDYRHLKKTEQEAAEPDPATAIDALSQN